MRKDCWMAGDGPLSLVPFAEVFRADLVEAGHPEGSLKHYFILMGQLDRWLSSQGWGIDELSEAAAQRFLNARYSAGYKRVLTMASLAPLFDCLRSHGIMPTPQPEEPTALERLLADYGRHLVHDRGVAPTTVRRYMRFARRFLTRRATRTATPTGTEGLTSVEVYAFMLEVGSRLVVESAKREAADLRALLRICTWPVGWTPIWGRPCPRWPRGGARRCLRR